MKNTLETAGTIFIIAGILLFLVLTFVVKSDGLTGTEDLFGLPIPQPPQFTTFIPYLGYLIGIVFEMFSFHGLVTLALPLSLIGIGFRIDKEINKLHNTKLPMRKSASLAQLDDAFKGKRFEDRLVAHLVKVGQIPDSNITEEKQTEEPSKEYLKRPSSELQKELEEYQRKQIESMESEPSKKLSEEGKEALGEYLTKTGQIKQ